MGHLHHLLTLGLGISTALFSQPKPPLRVSIVGTISTSKSPSYIGVMRELPVQNLMLTLAKGPKPESFIISALNNSRTDIKDLLELGLIRKDGNRYFINFALFTLEDQKLVLDVTNAYAESLEKAMLRHENEIKSIICDYDATGVDPKSVAYILVGCAGLDWNGLRLTADKGYRATTEHKPDGDYVPHAEENGEISVKKIYWGSRTDFFGDVQFTTFGDDVAKRLNLPDDFAETICNIMLSLRESPKNINELALTLGISRPEVEELISILSAYGWVEMVSNRYLIKIPVFTKRDAPMIKKVLSIVNQTMETWIQENYSKLRSDLKSMSYARSGVAFNEGFTMIWHYLFGLTNRKLIKAGLFADPYSEDRKFPGSIPVFFDPKIAGISPP